MFLRKIFFIFLIILIPIVGTARDYQFSSWEKLEKAVLKELRKIQELKDEVRELEIKYDEAEEKYHETEGKGWMGWFDPKQKARRKMDDAYEDLAIAENKLEKSEEKFKDLLTSTPPGNRLRNLMKFKANQEAIELKNSLDIVQGVVESLGAMFKTDQKNPMSAIEYYDTYLEMLGYLQSMHAGFISRVEGEYYQHFKNVWGQWLKHSNDIKKQLGKTTDKETKDLLQRKLKETSKVVSNMPKMLKALANMNLWAKKNLTKIRDKKTTVSFLKNHAILTLNTEEISDAVYEEFSGLKFEAPPIIEFKIDFPKFEKEELLEKEKSKDNEKITT